MYNIYPIIEKNMPFGARETLFPLRDKTKKRKN